VSKQQLIRPHALGRLVQASEPGLALGAVAFVSQKPKPANADALKKIITEWY
jgi:hypothetical protein